MTGLLQSLFSGCPQYLLNRLQKVQNDQPASSWELLRQTALHIIFTLCAGFQPMLESNTNFVLFVLVLSFLLVLSTFPIYSRFTQPLGNWSSADILCIPSVNTKTYSDRSFSYATPTLWNTLPKDIRFSQSVSSFRSALETHLFFFFFGLIDWEWERECVCVCV